VNVRELESSVDLDALRVRLQKMSDEELLKFGREMHALAHRRTRDHRAKQNVSAFSVQFDEARAEWRRRKSGISKDH
jgi:hypothetical protein